jgi:hypothetical protein
MPAIELPAGVEPVEMEHRFIDAGLWQRGALGGVHIRIDRPGSRYGITLQFPPIETRQVGRMVVSRLIQAQRSGMRVALPLGDFQPGSPGNPVVDGNDQAGTSIAVRGFTPGYAVREGQWFTHVQGDDAKLYNVAAPTIANALGKAIVIIEPELGLEPIDGDRLLFGKPVIQGKPVGNEATWKMSLARHIGFDLQIEEII